MKLYHGTTNHFHSQVLRHGLKPRSKRSSNWKKNPSRSDMVYLTTTYPFYFATMSRDEKIGVVYEIDTRHLDEDKLHPDEDFITHLANKRREKPLTEAQNRHVCKTLDVFQDMWRKSLMMLGNCAYQGRIPPKAITRYCLFDSAARPELTAYCMDAVISMMNFQFEGDKHRPVV